MLLAVDILWTGFFLYLLHTWGQSKTDVDLSGSRQVPFNAAQALGSVGSRDGVEFPAEHSDPEPMPWGAHRAPLAPHVLARVEGVNRGYVLSQISRR